jgi:polysaccharide biosynthesis/export protein
MKRNPHHALTGISLLVFCAATSAAQTNLQERINNAAQTHNSRPQSDVATPMRASGLAAVPVDFTKLKLAPGFLIGVDVLGDSDFAGNYRVDHQGNVAIPLLGMMHVAEQTPTEVREQIAKKLTDEQIMIQPQVSVTVLEYTVAEVAISGEVANPGRYPLLTPHKLSDLLATAGGTTPYASSKVDITRADGQGKSMTVHFVRGGDPEKNDDTLIAPGDSVQVRRAGIIYVLGAVTKPGGYVMQENGTLKLLQAVSLANGTTFPASLRYVYILRRNADGAETRIEVPYKKIVAGKMTDIEMQAADILYVPANGAKSYLQNIQSIVAATASASIYAGIVY